MTEQVNATLLPGSTHVAKKAYISAIRGAAAQYLEVPFSMVSASLEESEPPLVIRISSPISSRMLDRTSGSLVDSLGGVQQQLRSFLTTLLGCEVGAIDLSVKSIHEKLPPRRTDNAPKKTGRRVI
ncbi:hypothetical protein [Boudabousia marimammalium]|uniref:Uncharacterized protein n=1 Tax=Boudabousia marimammalium TaxID=156892 RepID=A0A1Q5PSQ1_9ACTO|nr:hypothetical protein [Boudabousia marimammalium]OKL50614.1 hypothetical protein BM477_01265 [Boudabousia marimammalium]